MEALRIEGLSFRYPKSAEYALKDISLTVKKGEFATLIGSTGSGKTTLLRNLKPAIAPFGTLSGEIFFEGRPLSRLSQREQSEKIGFVFQSPEDQLVTGSVWHELAFGTESLGLENAEIRLRVAESAGFFGIERLFRRDVSTLSGGEKQLVNLAAVMTMQPSLLVLDEPTAQLDPLAAAEFLHAIKRINLELGTTVLLSEHRTEEAVPMSDRLLVLGGGKLIADGLPREAGEQLRKENMGIFAAMPTPMRVWAAVPNALPCPLSVREGLIWLDDYSRSHKLVPVPETERPSEKPETVLELKELWYRYEKNGADVLRGLTARVGRGEVFAILGGNGAGKSTALSIMAGLSRPYRGKLISHGKVSLLPQNPKSLFLRPRLKDDLTDALVSVSCPKHKIEGLINETALLCGLGGLLENHPNDLSGGQLQMAALAKLLLLSPDILLLDEPTKGLDAVSREKLAQIIQSLSKEGKTIVLASHDVEFCARCATRCAMLFDGEISAPAPPREFFGQKSFITTAAARMSRGILEGAVLPEDVIRACGGSQACLPTPPPPPNNHAFSSGAKNPALSFEEVKALPEKKEKRRKPSARSLVSALLFLALIPLTIWLGLQFFGERRVYFVSLLVILECILPFFMLFEGRKPRARELVLIASLCALTVCARLAFYMLPQLKPAMALVIIAGACFGGEAGFLVGAFSAFISNFFFGQGPWTPWQMFATGLIGFLAGLLFSNSELSRKRLLISLYGFLACAAIFGGIMNTATVLISQAEVTPQAVTAALALGLPFDLIQGAATAVFLWLLTPVMSEKLGRIKTKYGILT